MDHHIIPLYKPEIHHKYIPVFELNTPDGGTQQEVIITDTTPIYSTLAFRRKV